MPHNPVLSSDHQAGTLHFTHSQSKTPDMFFAKAPMVVTTLLLFISCDYCFAAITSAPSSPSDVPSSIPYAIPSVAPSPVNSTVNSTLVPSISPSLNVTYSPTFNATFPNASSVLVEIDRSLAGASSFLSLDELIDLVSFRSNEDVSSIWGTLLSYFNYFWGITFHRKKVQTPKVIWFTHHSNILELKEPSNIYNNMKKTIDIYRNAWNDPDAPAYCLSNIECINMIGEVKPALVPFFLHESRGMFKADICRIAALYLHGGYYFDADLEVIHPVELDKGGYDFSTVYNEEGGFFFQAFLAAVPKHPVLASALDIMLDYYKGKMTFRYENHVADIDYLMGCITLYYAYEDYRLDLNEKHLLLKEINLVDHLPAIDGGADFDEVAKVNIYSRLELGHDCNYVVKDGSAHSSYYFWSRIVGEGICHHPVQTKR